MYGRAEVAGIIGGVLIVCGILFFGIGALLLKLFGEDYPYDEYDSED